MGISWSNFANMTPVMYYMTYGNIGLGIIFLLITLLTKGRMGGWFILLCFVFLAYGITLLSLQVNNKICTCQSK